MRVPTNVQLDKGRYFNRNVRMKAQVWFWLLQREVMTEAENREETGMPRTGQRTSYAKNGGSVSGIREKITEVIVFIPTFPQFLFYLRRVKDNKRALV